MKTNDLNKLPQYIEAPSGGMWGPMPAGFAISNRDAIFVKLNDVEALFSEVHSCRSSAKRYVCVGSGGEELEKKAKANAWTLYAYSNGHITDGWCGDSPSKKYFIKKEPDA